MKKINIGQPCVINGKMTCPLPSAKTADKRAKRAKQLFEDLKVIGDEDAAQEQYITMLTQIARAYLIRSDTYPCIPS